MSSESIRQLAESLRVSSSDFLVHSLEAEIPITVFRQDASSSEPTGCIFYIHGGGFTEGDRFSFVEELVRLVASDGVVGVTVDYRLAPMHPYPAALDDCQTAFDWVVENAKRIGIDDQRIVLFGVSAGGGLAASLALLARDTGAVQLRGQLLSCPMLDDRTQAGPDERTGSLRTWTYYDNRLGWASYLGSWDARQGYAVPARTRDLTGLPATFIDVGTEDIFLGENVEYAQRILASRVPVELRLWEGGYHGFDLLEPDSPIAKRAIDARHEWLRSLKIVSRNVIEDRLRQRGTELIP